MGNVNIVTTRIIGTGSCIPEKVVKNSHFLDNSFYGADKKRIVRKCEDGSAVLKTSEEIIHKFEEITGIKERRYALDSQVNSDLASAAALDAILSSGTDREALDFIIVAHNFGDVKYGSTHVDMVPSIASRVKSKLEIKNPFNSASDLVFGCPGWLKAVEHADALIRAGYAKKGLVIGSDTLSRVSDFHDINSMIYADGAGAAVLEGINSEVEDSQAKNGKLISPKNIEGIISFSSRSDASTHLDLLSTGSSFNPIYPQDDLFIKMDGHDVYKYAISYVPVLVKEHMESIGASISDVSKIFLHQANEKMNVEIAKRLIKLCGSKIPYESIAPMTIQTLGNTSSATVPILYDLVSKGKIPGHSIYPGDLVFFVSVGAGMNISSMAYRQPRK